MTVQNKYFRDRLAGFNLLPKTLKKPNIRIYAVDNHNDFGGDYGHIHYFEAVTVSPNITILKFRDNEKGLPINHQDKGDYKIKLIVNHRSGKINLIEASEDFKVRYENLNSKLTLEEFAIHEVLGTLDLSELFKNSGTGNLVTNQYQAISTQLSNLKLKYNSIYKNAI